MFRYLRIRLSVAATVGAVLISGFVFGSDQTTTDPLIVPPSFLVEVAVGPATGPMKIPPANPPSKPYAAYVRVHDSTVGSFWSMHRGAMYVGDRAEEQGDYGPYRITCSVWIDERGETAQVEVVSRRADGAEPVQAYVQRFTIHLPPSQMIPG